MNQAHRLVPAALVLVVAAHWLIAPVAAGDQVLRLDPSATEVSFHLDATGHAVEGRLALVEGEVRFDPASGAASGRLAVDARSAETGNAKRDKTMHRKVLESAEHPLFVFRPERLEGEIPASGAASVALVGTMSILGADHPLTMPAEIQVEDDRLSARVQFDIPFVEWGMHDPSILFLRVAKTVQVVVDANGSLEPGGVAASDD